MSQQNISDLKVATQDDIDTVLGWMSCPVQNLLETEVYNVRVAHAPGGKVETEEFYKPLMARAETSSFGVSVDGSAADSWRVQWTELDESCWGTTVPITCGITAEQFKSGEPPKIVLFRSQDSKKRAIAIEMPLSSGESCVVPAESVPCQWKNIDRGRTLQTTMHPEAATKPSDLVYLECEVYNKMGKALHDLKVIHQRQGGGVDSIHAVTLDKAKSMWLWTGFFKEANAGDLWSATWQDGDGNRWEVPQFECKVTPEDIENGEIKVLLYIVEAFGQEAMAVNKSVNECMAWAQKASDA